MRRFHDDEDLVVPEDDAYWEAEGNREQRRRAHVLVRKLRRRRGAGGGECTPETHDLSVDDCGAIFSAADFAQYAHCPLDLLVTLDGARLGITDERGIEREVRRFIKCYTAWASERLYPIAWIYALEANNAKDGVEYHGHIALHVPDITSGWPTPPAMRSARSAFRKWAKEYIARKMGTAVPRAIWISGSLTQSNFRHWNAVTYLMKGCDWHAVVQSARTSPDGRIVRLGDLMPWPYCSPGVIRLAKRYGISHNLGPKQRLVGIPSRAEPTSSYKFNIAALDICGPKTRFRPGVPTSVLVTTPFRSAWEDGIRDVRKLYSGDFYRFVTKQEPYEPSAPLIVEHTCLTCQLREIALR